MTGYCETHGRKFIGEGCPWCSNAGPVANGEPRVANTTPTAIDVANAVANRDGRQADMANAMQRSREPPAKEAASERSTYRFAT